MEEPLWQDDSARYACRKSSLCAVSRPFRPAGWMKTELPRILLRAATLCPCLPRISFADLHCQNFLLRICAFIRFLRPLCRSAVAPYRLHLLFFTVSPSSLRCRALIPHPLFCRGSVFITHWFSGRSLPPCRARNPLFVFVRFFMILLIDKFATVNS